LDKHTQGYALGWYEPGRWPWTKHGFHISLQAMTTTIENFTF
jgi:hypothetical protein